MRTESTFSRDLSFVGSVVQLIGVLVITLLLASCGVGWENPPYKPEVKLHVTNGANVDGDIIITLEPEKAPISVANFLAYVNSGFYSGTVFHRIGPNSTGALRMVQGGGFIQGPSSLVLKSPTRAPIELEVGKGLSNLQWSIAMARTDQPNTATSQFFINYFSNTDLDTAGGGYAVFGTVTGGFNVVNAIAGISPCTARAGVTISPYCTPTTNITIVSAVQTR
jgi:cyclophilin family peptidyl-prolyl cis-trans isomerase